MREGYDPMMGWWALVERPDNDVVLEIQAPRRPSVAEFGCIPPEDERFYRVLSAVELSEALKER